MEYCNEERKCFHFQELGWILSFPMKGNEDKKYVNYKVEFTEPTKKITYLTLFEIVNSPEFEKFPHTIGFFRCNNCLEFSINKTYLEIRIVRSLEEFWKFLNDLDI